MDKSNQSRQRLRSSVVVSCTVAHRLSARTVRSCLNLADQWPPGKYISNHASTLFDWLEVTGNRRLYIKSSPFGLFLCCFSEPNTQCLVADESDVVSLSFVPLRRRSHSRTHST